MNKLSKEKRNQLILVILVTVLSLAGLWFGLISFQQRYLLDLAARKQSALTRQAKIERAIKNADQIENDLAEATKKLSELEDNMASGDLYNWMFQVVRNFRLPYKVEI